MHRSRSETAEEAVAGSRTEPDRQLTDEQWSLIKDLFANPAPSEKGGRPRAPARACLEGVLWILRTGARWKDVPRVFGSATTCWRRFKQWAEAGVFRRAWARLLRKLDGLGRVDWEQALADGTFSSAKKGATASARPNAGRALKLWSWPTAEDCRWPARFTAPVRTK